MRRTIPLKLLWLPLLVALLTSPLLADRDTVRKGAKMLQRALNTKNADDRDAKIGEAIGVLVEEGSEDAVEVLLDTAVRIPDDAGDRIYWQLINGVAAFTSPGGCEAIAEFVVKKKRHPIVRDVVSALQGNTNPATVPIHEAVLDKAITDLMPMSIDTLAAIRTAASVDVLIAKLKEENEDYPGSPIERQIVSALRKVTGEDMGDVLNWVGWWEANRDEGLPPKKTGHTGTVVDDLGAGELRGLEKAPPGQILVIKGTPCKKGNHDFDDVQYLLDQMSLPHKVITKKEVNSDEFDTKGVMAIVVNCMLFTEHCVCPTCEAGGTKANRLLQCQGCDKHDIEQDKFTAEAVKKIKAFVERGGYLFTEDWNLEELVAVAWPNMVQPGKKLNKMTVEVQLERGMTSHPYLRRIFDRGRGGGHGGTMTHEEMLKRADHKWQIDKDSPVPHIVSKKVTKLLVSEELRKGTGGDDCLALTFTAGRGSAGGVDEADRRPRTGGRKWRRKYRERTGGRVLHVLSHFGKQQSAQDEAALQNLLLNFLLEARERWLAYGGK